MPPRPKKSDARDPLDGYREIDRQLRASSVPNPSLTPVTATDADVQRHLDDLRDIATSLGAAVDLRDILDRIVDGILRVARCERGFVILMGDDGSFATYTGRLRDRGEWDERDARQISATIVTRVAASRQPFIVSDLEEIADLRERGSILEGKIRAAVCLPLLHDQRLIGLIYADNSFVTPQFTEPDRGALQLFGIEAAYSIESARRQGELKDRSERLAEENLSLARHIREFAMGGMISRSREMLDIFETVHKIAPSDISVLVLGESGTGKELLARAIHDKSSRRGRPFQAVNCAGIPSELVESTLFGYVKGAFTGADTDRPGMFEAANGGTLFLDEIGDMPMATQPKLLRVLQEKEFNRVGEVGRVRPVDVRIISATNLDLARAVEDGEFREDLFYRLNGVSIDLPPLRNRREDILPLAEYFLDRYAEEKKQPRAQLAADAKALLLTHTWAGNVRRLKSVIETGIAFQDEDRVIHAKALERSLQGRERSALADARLTGSLRELIDRFEEQLVRRTLAENDNNVTNAAKALDLSRQQLYNKIRKYRIDVRAE
jgi:Nif-specific regulatory protein